MTTKLNFPDNTYKPPINSSPSYPVYQNSTFLSSLSFNAPPLPNPGGHSSLRNYEFTYQSPSSLSITPLLSISKWTPAQSLNQPPIPRITLPSTWDTMKSIKSMLQETTYRALNPSPLSSRPMYLPEEKFFYSQIQQNLNLNNSIPDFSKTLAISFSEKNNPRSTVHTLLIDTSQLPLTDLFTRARMPTIQGNISELVDLTNIDGNEAALDKMRKSSHVTSKIKKWSQRGSDKDNIRNLFGGIFLSASEFFMNQLNHIAEAGLLAAADDFGFNRATKTELQDAMRYSLSKVHHTWDAGLVAAVNFDPRSDHVLQIKKIADWGFVIANFYNPNTTIGPQCFLAKMESTALQCTKSNLLKGKELHTAYKTAEIAQLEKRISEWLGEGAKLIRNEAGDSVVLSKDGLRCIRFDFNKPKPHNNPHAHVEIKTDGKWVKSGQIYPKDVPHN